MNQKSRVPLRICAAMCVAAAFPNYSAAATLDIDIASIASGGEFLSGNNTVFQYNIGANAAVTAVSYSVLIEAYHPSWLSELGAVMTDTSTLNGFVLRPGFGVNTGGSTTFSGTVNLLADGTDFAVGADGLLRIEFAEDAYDGLSPDGLWRSGTSAWSSHRQYPNRRRTR